MLITDDEIKEGRASPGDKSTTILSLALERVEEEIIAALSSHLKEQCWVTSSLIHDDPRTVRVRNWFAVLIMTAVISDADI